MYVSKRPTAEASCLSVKLPYAFGLVYGLLRPDGSDLKWALDLHKVAQSGKAAF